MRSMAMRKAALLLILVLGIPGVGISFGQKSREKSNRPPKEKLKIVEKEKSAPGKERDKGRSKKNKPDSSALNRISSQPGRLTSLERG